MKFNFDQIKGVFSGLKDKGTEYAGLAVDKTRDAARLAKATVELNSEKETLKKFRRSFCCDEFFVRSILDGSDVPVIYDDKICYVEFVHTTPRIFKEGDLDYLLDSGALFFRTMYDSNIGLAKKIEERICG